MCIHDEQTHSQHFSDSSVDCSLVFVWLVPHAIPCQSKLYTSHSNMLHERNSFLQPSDVTFGQNESFQHPFLQWGFAHFLGFSFQWSHSICFVDAFESKEKRRRFAELCTNPPMVPNTVAYGVARVSSPPETTTSPWSYQEPQHAPVGRMKNEWIAKASNSLCTSCGV